MDGLQIDDVLDVAIIFKAWNIKLDGNYSQLEKDFN